MSRLFVIADLHFGHEKVAQARGFGDAATHDAVLVEAWNRVVRKRDVVYVLGDVFRLNRVSELAGTKKIALGNHDGNARQYIELFSQVRACFDVDNVLLTHIPVHPSQFARWPLNIHGHTHTRHIDDERYVPVSAEHCTRWEPLPLRELITARLKRVAVSPSARKGEGAE